MINTGMMSSDRPDWNTPQTVLDRVYAMGEIDLDPCSNPQSIVRARRTYSLEDGQDGLAETWGVGLVFVNPPYGHGIEQWMWKAVDAASKGATVIALIPARTDTAWFQVCWQARAICFWHGRIRFLGAPSSAPFPSAVVLFGDRQLAFSKHFEDAGRVVIL